ncbi:MAG: BatD family protein, partial [Candidatus Omnitrophota bacterium]
MLSIRIKSFLLILFLSVGFFSFADDINFSISVDKRKITIGEAVYLNLIFEGTQEIGAPDLGIIEGFSVQYVGPSSKMTIVNGKASSSIIHIYVLVPMKVGTFQVGPFSVSYKGSEYTCESIEIEVIKGVSSVSGEETESSDLEDRIFLAIEPSKTKVYLNEIFDVKVKLYAYNLGVENIYYPQISHNGFSLQEITKPIRYRDIVGSKTFDVMEFNTKASPLQRGQLSLGPASLKCDILMRQKKKRRGIFNDFDSFFGDFFSEYSRQPITLNSPQLPITVLPLPAENKPLSFDGAVGQFTFDVEAHPRQLNVGDPVTLRFIVGGEGNFGTVKFPALQFDSRDFKVYEPQVSVEKKTKIFESVLIPLKDDVEYI